MKLRSENVLMFIGSHEIATVVAQGRHSRAFFHPQTIGMHEIDIYRLAQSVSEAAARIEANSVEAHVRHLKPWHGR